MSSPRPDGGVLPWDAEAEVTAFQSAIWSWIKDLDLVSGAATHQEAVLYMGQVMRIKRESVCFVAGGKEGDTVGGMREVESRSEGRVRDVACFSPAGVSPLQPENISSPFPRPEAVVPLRPDQLCDPTLVPGVCYTHLKGITRDASLILNSQTGSLGPSLLVFRLFDCRLVVRPSHTDVEGSELRFVFSQTSDE